MKSARNSPHSRVDVTPVQPLIGQLHHTIASDWLTASSFLTLTISYLAPAVQSLSSVSASLGIYVSNKCAL